MADNRKKALPNQEKMVDDLQVLFNRWFDMGSFLPDEVLDGITTANSQAEGNMPPGPEILHPMHNGDGPGGPFNGAPQPGYVPGQQFFQFGPMMPNRSPNLVPMENTVHSGSMPGMHYVPQGNGGVAMMTNSMMNLNSTVMSGGFVADSSVVQAAQNPTMMPQWPNPAQNGPIIYPGWSGMPTEPFDVGCGLCQMRPAGSFEAEVTNPGMLVPLYPYVLVPNTPWHGNGIPGAPIGMNVAQEGGVAEQTHLQAWSWAKQVQTTVVPPQTAALYQPTNQLSPRPIEAAATLPGTPNHKRGPTQTAPDYPVLTDLAKIMTSKEALVILYHAYKCLEGETDSPNNRNCTLSRCGLTKELIKDMMSCPWGDSCIDLRCTNASRIINHWKRNCKLPDCPLCVPVRDI